jgi:hypothetical protein
MRLRAILLKKKLETTTKDREINLRKNNGTTYMILELRCK